MDPIDLAILGLRVLLVALLYAFLVSVVRLALRGLQVGPPATNTRPRLARTNRLQLMVVEPGSASLVAGEVVAVSDGGIVGRAETCDVRLQDAAVSAEHARVSRTGRSWVVVDLGSTNGTRVNDAVISGETALAAGDVLGLGNVRLRVVAR